jgi:hypothetical protein
MVDPETHSWLQLDHDCLSAENVALRRRVDERDRLIAELRDDLAASAGLTPMTSLASLSTLPRRSP